MAGLLLLILLQMPPELPAQSGDFSSFLIGRLYRGNNQFSRNVLLQMEAGRISARRNGVTELPQQCIDLSRFWALPPPQYPLTPQDLSGAAAGPAATELFLSSEELDSLRRSLGSGTESLYLHPSADAMTGWTIRSGPAADTERLPVLTADTFNANSLRHIFRQCAAYALKNETSVRSPEIYLNSYFNEGLLELMDGQPLVFSFQTMPGDSLGEAAALCDSLRLICRPWRQAAESNAGDSAVSKLSGDSLKVFDADVWTVFSDIGDYISYSRSPQNNLKPGRILIQRPGDWISQWRSHPSVPLPDLIYLNVRNYYSRGGSAGIAAAGDESNLILFDGDPREPESRISYIIVNGELRHYLSE